MGMKILRDGTLIDYLIAENNCKIERSFLVKSKAAKYEFINFLVKKHPEFKKRSIKSYYWEWKAHNILYKLHIGRSGTRDTDLSINESKIRRIGYFIISMFSIDF